MIRACGRRLRGRYGGGVVDLAALLDRDRVIEIRNTSDIKAYTVEAAVKTALYYRDQRNICVGMMAARDKLLGHPES